MKELFQTAIAHPTLSCLFFLVAYWSILRIILICSHLAASRPISDGPSLFPANVVWTVVALAIAWPLNLLVPLLGTGLIVCIALGYPIWALTRQPPSSKTPRHNQP